MTDGYLSKDREHIAGRQRQRRARMARIDYYPSPDALALIESRRTRYGPTNNYSGIIDTIIAEWAVLAGLKQSEIDKTKSPATSPELCEQYARMRITSASETSMRAGVTSGKLAKCAGVRAGASPAPPELPDASQARAPANEFDLSHANPEHPTAGATAAPEFIDASMRANNSGSLPAGTIQARVICGAKRRRDGEPCQGLSVPGKLRCKWHGGASTGPRTDEGRARSMANLRQFGGKLDSKAELHAQKLTAEERSVIAKKAAKARWSST
ncbi:MAG: HGGxSTG domain-containing protein [Pseudomonadota bacterium]